MSLDPCPSDAELLRMAAERTAKRAAVATFARPIAPEPKRRARRTRPRGASEIAVQTTVVRKLKEAGIPCWRVGQRDARGTQDAGVSDVIALVPGRGVWFLEMKREIGGVQSEAQRTFEAACVAAGVAYRIVRSVEDVSDLLSEPINRGKDVQHG